MSKTQLSNQGGAGSTQAAGGAGGAANQQQQNNIVTPQLQASDNAGSDDEILSEFWDGLDDEADGGESPQQGGQQPVVQQQNQQQQGPQPAPNTEAILDMLTQSLKFSGLSQDAIDKLANGDISGLNAGFDSVGKQAVRHAVAATGQLMAGLQARLMTQMKQAIKAELNQYDNSGFLEAQMPSVDPVVKPVVKALFDQALIRSKGNKQQAIDLTKKMLSRLGYQQGGNNRGKGNNSQQQQSATNWAEELGIKSNM